MIEAVCDGGNDAIAVKWITLLRVEIDCEACRPKSWPENWRGKPVIGCQESATPNVRQEGSESVVLACLRLCYFS